MRISVLVATVVMLLSGCGGGDNTETGGPVASPAAPDNGVTALAADEILAKARAALEQAGSYRMKGKATEQGTKIGVDVTVAGADFRGTLSFADAAEVELLKPEGRLSKGGTLSIAFTPVVELTDSGNAENKLYVATTGDPYPVVLGELTGDRVEFSDFGASFPDVKAPAAGEFIEQSKIQ